MYVAVKGGERAIDNAHAWLAEERRGDTDVAELSIAQIREQLKPRREPGDGRGLAL
jgi:alpha-D-ribose 1-methylphosphonate 5-triphosphate synthase subunit PhnI